MTIAPASPRQVPTVTVRGGGGGEPDLLDRLRSPATPRPAVDAGLADGLRAWLEDGALGLDAVDGPDGPIVVRDGSLLSLGPPRTHLPEVQRKGTRAKDLREDISRTIFRLTVTDGPPRHPLEDALCAISVTERGPDVLGAVGRLGTRGRGALRTFARCRAEMMAASWRPVPSAWLPRAGERMSVPLHGGRVVLAASVDLVVGRPFHDEASVCLVRVLEGHHRVGTSSGRDHRIGSDEQGRRVRKALALAETLRSGAPPWRVATYDANSGRLDCEDATVELLVSSVRDVLCELELLRR